MIQHLCCAQGGISWMLALVFVWLCGLSPSGLMTNWSALPDVDVFWLPIPWLQPKIPGSVKLALFFLLPHRWFLSVAQADMNALPSWSQQNSLCSSFYFTSDWKTMTIRSLLSISRSWKSGKFSVNQLKIDSHSCLYLFTFSILAPKYQVFQVKQIKLLWCISSWLTGSSLFWCPSLFSAVIEGWRTHTKPAKRRFTFARLQLVGEATSL